MSAFKVGDVCVFQHLDSWRAQYNDTECVIVGGLATRYGSTSKKERLCYKVHAQLDGDHWLVEQPFLRRKEEPSNYDGNQAGEWDLCPWQPKRERA